MIVKEMQQYLIIFVVFYSGFKIYECKIDFWVRM